MPRVTTLILLLVLPLPAAAQSRRQQLMEMLAHEKRQEREQAYRSVTTDMKSMLPTALRAVARLRAADVKTYEQRVRELREAIRGFDSKSGKQRLARSIGRWQTEARKALKLAMDEQLFPNPGPKKVIRGPWKGYSKVIPQVNRARKRFAALLALVEAASEKLGKVDVTFAELGRLEKLIEERAAFLAPHRKVHPAFQPQRLPFFERLERLARGKRKEALEGVGKLAEPQRSLLFVFYGLKIHELNKRAESGMTRDALDGVRIINEIRMALMVLPMQADKILTQCIMGHLNEMQKLGFWGHFSPTAERRTPLMRARLAGWEHRVGEGLSSAGCARAAEIWAWDGGHYRLMIAPMWTHIGMGYVERSGINVGVGEKFAFPRPEFFPE